LAYSLAKEKQDKSAGSETEDKGGTALTHWQEEMQREVRRKGTGCCTSVVMINSENFKASAGPDAVLCGNILLALSVQFSQ